MASDGAEFRQLSQKRARGDVADPGNGLEQRLSLAPNGRSVDGLADIPVELCEHLLQEGDVAAKPSGQLLVPPLDRGGWSPCRSSR